jgi:hypothetical protein
MKNYTFAGSGLQPEPKRLDSINMIEPACKLTMYFNCGTYDLF